MDEKDIISNNKKKKRVVPAIKLTNDEFLKRVKSLTGSEYTFLEDYEIACKKILVRHNTCGHCYLVAPNHFLGGRRCPKCNKFNNERLTNEEFLEKAKSLTGSEYTFLEDYETTHKKILVRHNTCGHCYLVTPNHFLGGRRCPKCFGTPKKTQEEVEKEIRDNSNGEFSLVSKYNNGRSKISIKHKKCGLTFETTLDNFRKSLFLHCPFCKHVSKGELIIENILKKLNIFFRKEVRFEECKDIRMLPFDFAIYYDEDCLSIRGIIEFDGRQHFEFSSEENSFCRNESDLDDRKRKDKIKDDFCKKNGIKLLRIPYTKISKIEKIINNFLSSTTIPNGSKN